MLGRILTIAALAAGPALAQDGPAYVDDRSTPEAVIQSYYNAINRFEYARAYGYFGAGDGPADYDSWEFGYSDTQSVAVSFGASSEEGAAGSIFYAVPVALDVERTEGQHAQFAGCYFLRLAQPAIQGVPFAPMHIEEARLEADAEMPAGCER